MVWFSPGCGYGIEAQLGRVCLPAHRVVTVRTQGLLGSHFFGSCRLGLLLVPGHVDLSTEHLTPWQRQRLRERETHTHTGQAKRKLKSFVTECWKVHSITSTFHPLEASRWVPSCPHSSRDDWFHRGVNPGGMGGMGVMPQASTCSKVPSLCPTCSLLSSPPATCSALPVSHGPPPDLLCSCPFFHGESCSPPHFCLEPLWTSEP